MTVLNVRNTAASVKFYQMLGFHSAGTWGDADTGFAIVQRGHVSIALDGHPVNPFPQNAWWSVYIYVDDVYACRADIEAHGVAAENFSDANEYGCIDFNVVDPDGHRIAFGQDKYSTTSPGLGTNTGRG